METALEKFFPIDGNIANRSFHLRCFSHLRDDMKRALMRIGVEDCQEIPKEILGTEISGLRIEGLVDADTEEVFEDLFEERKKIWPSEFNTWLETKKGRLRNIPDMIKKSMLKPVRIAAGLGNPPNQWTNNTCEALHAVVKEEQNNESLDLCSFIHNVKEKVFDQQLSELTKAIYRMGEYRLAPEFQHHSVDPLQWGQMSVEQKAVIVKKVFSTEVPTDQDVSFGSTDLSVDLDNLRLDLQLPLTTLRKLWSSTDFILKNCSVSKLLSGNFCVTDYDNCFNIFFDKEHALVCPCLYFRHNVGLCPHVMAVAEKENMLMNILTQYSTKKNKFGKMVEINQPKRSGEKPHEKKKRRGANNVRKSPITAVIQLQRNVVGNIGQVDHFDPELDKEKECHFSEYWQNDELFYIIHLGDKEECKNAKACTSCGRAFAKRNPTLYENDVIISHRERYQRPVKDEKGNFLRKTITKPNQLGRKFYCPQKECILKRHPYFWKKLLKVHKGSCDKLEDTHFDILFKNLHFQEKYAR